jgi:hypothetical protein
LGHRWEDDIKIGLQEIGWEGADWTDVVLDRNQCWEGADWTDVVLDRNQSLALVNAGINVQFHKLQAVSLLAPWNQFALC